MHMDALTVSHTPLSIYRPIPKYEHTNPLEDGSCHDHVKIQDYGDYSARPMSNMPADLVE